MALDKEQELARTITGTSVVVSASAGAGKTSVLVQRLLKRCLEDGVELDRILAMTFTKAAAEEMKKRLASSLSERYATEENKEKKQYIESQLIKLNNASITTIDSYCLSIIQKYYSVIGLDPATTENILDEGNSAILKHEAFLNTFQKLIKTNPESAMRLSSFFSARCEDYETLEETVFSIITHAGSGYDPDAFYAHALSSYGNFHGLKDFPEDIRNAFFDSLLVRIERMQDTLEEMVKIADETESKADIEKIYEKKMQLENCRNALLAQSYPAYQNALETCILTDPPADSKNVPYSTVRKQYTDGMKALLKDAYDEKILVEDVRKMAPVVNDLIQLAIDTSDCFSTMKKEHTCMDFTDMERFALNILNASNGEIADTIRSSFDEIMVDEFQDTSALQNAIIEKIAKADNVFRVGDVKQSIYRFREADPSLMRNLMKDPHQRCITLRHNYRSKQSIVEFNNLLFGKLLNIDGFADAYTEEDTVSIGRDAQKEEPVPVEFDLVKEDEEVTGDKERKAKWIAEKILLMHEEGRGFSDFCVLVRSHKNKLVLRSAFEAYGIPYEIDTREGFYNSSLCLEIQEMIQYMLNPKDNLALCSVLTSGLYHMEDEELAMLKTGRATLVAGVAEERPDIPTLFAELRNIAINRGIVEMLQEIAVTNNYYNRLSTHNKANFDFLLQKAAATKSSTLSDFLRLMQSGSEDRSSEASSHKKDDDTVQVVTIHQSKGLQYKVVFLWADNENRFNEKMDRVSIHNRLMLGVPYFDETYRLFRPTVNLMAVRHAIDMEDQQEFIRLLYVALTRAEERMFIVDVPSDKPMSKSVTRSLSSRRKGMSALLFAGGVGNPLFTIEEVSLQHLPPLPPLPHTFVDQLPKFAMDAQHIPPLHTPSSTEFTTLPPLSDKEKQVGKQYGTYMHECIAQLPDKVWEKEDFIPFSLSDHDTERLMAFAESDIYKKCLTMHIHKEDPFFVISEDGQYAITGSFDMVAENEEEVILIDFKTDHADSETIRNRYQAQIEEYKKALHILYPEQTIHAYAYSLYNSAFISL